MQIGTAFYVFTSGIPKMILDNWSDGLILLTSPYVITCVRQRKKAIFYNDKRGITMASFKEIQAQIEQLQQQAAAQRENELTGAIQRIRDLMQECGITVDDLQPKGKKGAVKKSGIVKFRNSQTGDTWSGRGRMPHWLAGQDKEQFRV
jgi:DNA-binding protein H-NS